MRIAFAGTPEVAVPVLDALAASSHEVALVLTRPDAPLGRKRTLTPSPVAARADELGIPVERIARPSEATAARTRAAKVDLGVVVAYGAILRQEMLDAPRLGWINLHFSALPAWRGAAPVQRAMMAGEPATALSVFQLDNGMDTGPLYSQTPVPFTDEETAGEALTRLSRLGAHDVLRVVDALEAGSAVATPQAGAPTVAPKLTLADGLVDWHAPAERVIAHIRGVTPEPGAASVLAGARFKLHAVRRWSADAPRLAPGEVTLHRRAVLVGTDDWPIELTTVQPFGKPSMPADAWWRGQASERVQFDDAAAPSAHLGVDGTAPGA